MQDKIQADEKLVGRKEGRVAHIIFNNPAKYNAVSLDMWARMDALLSEFEADDSIRALVISGAGDKAFISGADISKFESERASREAVAEYNEIAYTACSKLYNFPKPTIARIQGYCIGGGVNVAACCDLRYCTEGSRFAVPAAKLGLGYGYTGLKRLSDIVGISRTMEIFYTARQYSSQEAYEMGLVNAIVGNDELEDHVVSITERIAGNAPLTIGTVKAAVREIGNDADKRDLEKIDAMVRACFESEDYIEGRRAFMEKRKPQFKGR